MAIVFTHLPVTPLRITSRFGPRNTGIAGASTNHAGIDLGRNFNLVKTPVCSVAKGFVSDNYWNAYRGWVIKINHGEFVTLYQHLESRSTLAIGTEVKSGQQLGIMGNSSDPSKLAVSVHLHMELHIDGTPINPEPYLLNIQEEEEEVTQEQFNKMLKTAMAELSKEPESTWSKNEGYFKKARDKNVIASDDPQSLVNKEALAAILGRAGLLK